MERGLIKCLLIHHTKSTHTHAHTYARVRRWRLLILVIIDTQDTFKIGPESKYYSHLGCGCPMPQDSKNDDVVLVEPGLQRQLGRAAIGWGTRPIRAYVLGGQAYTFMYPNMQPVNGTRLIGGLC